MTFDQSDEKSWPDQWKNTFKEQLYIDIKEAAVFLKFCLNDVQTLELCAQSSSGLKVDWGYRTISITKRGLNPSTPPNPPLDKSSFLPRRIIKWALPLTVSQWVTASGPVSSLYSPDLRIFTTADHQLLSKILKLLALINFPSAFIHKQIAQNVELKDTTI